MTATRSITWGIPSTSSRMASRTIIPATFTARRNPGTVSQSLLRLRDFCAGMTTASGMLGATCGVVLPDFHRDALMSAKIATGEKKIAFPRWLLANAPSWARESVCTNASCVYVCVCVCIRVDTLQLKLRFLTWKREVDLKNRKLASTARRYDVAVMCIRVLYKGIKLPKVSKLYRCISWPSWSQFFLNESMEVLYIRAISELYMCDRK